MLLRSDGTAVACGESAIGYCFHGVHIPSPKAGTFYVCDVSQGRDLVLQIDLDPVGEDDQVRLTCSGLTGEEVICWTSSGTDLAWDAHKRLARELNVYLQSFRVVLPDGQLLASVCRANPAATLANVCESCKGPHPTQFPSERNADC